MADKTALQYLLISLQQQGPLSLREIQVRLADKIPERTLRRWLSNEVKKGKLIMIGAKRSTRYLLADLPAKKTNFKFLQGKPSEQQQQILEQLRDLWTHTSTAIEGNTLSLGDTHFLLEEGLTVSGKAMKEHQEVIGHASAIELLYQSLTSPINDKLCFDLHKAIQSEIIFDIDKPNGAWKVVINGTYTVGVDNKQIYLEYAQPQHVPFLMRHVFAELNSKASESISQDSAHIYYAKIHAAIAHIHPFWDGNGRMARLLANVPLLKSGLPPIIIPKEKRRQYIQTLAKYQLKSGQLNNKTSPWPRPELLADFEVFCLGCYQATLDIVR